MEIVYKTGDLIKCHEPLLVHGCNTKKMGAGVANLVRIHFPEAYDAYLNNARILGEVIFAESNDKIIANGITQRDYGRDDKQYVSYDAVRSVIRIVDNYCKSSSFDSFALPKIGAGLGGGDWHLISQIIEEETKFAVPVVYCLPE